MAQALFDTGRLAPWIARGYVVLTPNLRLARIIQTAWDERQLAAGSRVWEPAPVFPLEDWLFSQWQRAVEQGRLPARIVLDAQQESLLWQQAIDRHYRDQAALPLLKAGAAARLASEARVLLRRWQLDIRASAVREAFAREVDCRDFLAWSDLFDAALAAGGMATRADCLAALAGVGPDESAATGPSVLLVSSAERTPLSGACFSAIRAQVEELAGRDRAAAAVLHPFSDQRTEWQAVASWAATLHREQPTATLGIVVGGTGTPLTRLEYLLRREFECLGDNYDSLPVNFSAGISLGAAPVVRDAFRALSTALPQISAQDVAGLAGSRFVALPDTDSAGFGALARALHEAGQRDFTADELRWFATRPQSGAQPPPALGERLLAIASLRELRGRAAPSAWIDRFQAVLAVWGWPGGESLDSVEFQQVQLWYRTVDEFRRLDLVCGALTYAEALALLRERCDLQISHPHTRERHIHVLGPLEAAGLQFDHLWVCGMQSTAWPGTPRANPFIPLTLPAARAMPRSTAEQEWQFATALLRQYRADNAVLHASYSRQVDGVPEQASSLIADFEEQVLPALPEVSAAWRDAQARTGRELLPEDAGPALTAVEIAEIRGGTALLADQSQCPFRAFARHRLLAVSVQAVPPGLSPAERGIVVHAALRALWGELRDQSTLHALSAEARHAAVYAAARAGTEDLPARRWRVLGKSCLDLEVARTSQLLLDWLDVEGERVPFTVEAREFPAQVNIAGLTIAMRIDRLDRQTDGRRILIDYKTGQSSPRDWLGERPAQPQLPLYSLALDDPPVAVAVARLRPRDVGLCGLGAEQIGAGVDTDIAGLDRQLTEALDWPGLLADWRQRLTQLAASFAQGAAGIVPLPGSCRHCGLQALCRVEDVPVPREGPQE